MAVTDQQTVFNYTASGASSAFSFSCRILDDGDLVVLVDGVEQTLDVDYTVSGAGFEHGGSVDFAVAPAAASAVRIYRQMAVERLTDYQTAGDFLANTVNPDFDRPIMILQDVLDGSREIQNVLRVPAGEQINTLPDAATRGGTLLGFAVGTGQPVTIIPSVDSAAALALSLASTAGAGLLGLALTLAYGAGTVGGFLRGLNHISSYGTLNNDGVNDDSAVYQAAANSGDPFIDVSGVNSRIAATINGASNQVWVCNGARFTLSSSTLTMWNFATKTDFAFLGAPRITGDGNAAGTAKAFNLVDCSRYLLDAPQIFNVKGWGIFIDPGVSTTLRHSHGTIRDAVIDNCWYGYEDVAGTGAEYTSINNPRITRCSVHGLRTAAGNTVVTGGHIVDNLGKGVHLYPGANSGHGIFNGVNINHNATFGIHAEAILNGFTFSNCHIVENDVWLDRCKGIVIEGGTLDANVYNYKDGSSGLNYIKGPDCPGDGVTTGYGVSRLVGSNDGHDQLIITGLTGIGSHAAAGGKDTAGVTLNDPSSFYVFAQRDVAATQSLTSGVVATLTFSAGLYLHDRRGAANLGAGTVTIQAEQGGEYHIDFAMLFGGTAMSAIASFVEVKIGGVTKEIFLPAIFGTTKLQVRGSFDRYLNAGDVVTFVATIVGTTPSFGDATWPSTASIRRIA